MFSKFLVAKFRSPEFRDLPRTSVSKRANPLQSKILPTIGNNSETNRLLVLFTNRKSHTGFRLVPKSVTLNDLEGRNGRYFTLFYQIR